MSSLVQPEHLFITILLTASFIINTYQYSAPGSCPDDQYYNYFNHNCQACPPNTIPSQTDNTYCNCSRSHYPNPDSMGFMHSTSCNPLAAPLGENQIALVYNKNGVIQSPVNPLACTNGYPNQDRTQCIPCGINMFYNSNLKMCVCLSTNFFPVGEICMDGSSINQLPSDPEKKILYGIGFLGCSTTIQSKQYCQIILNKCAQSGYLNTNQFCILLFTNINNKNVPQYTTTSSSLNVSLDIYASSVTGTDTTSVKNKLNFYINRYNKFGELQDIKPLGAQILPCVSTQQDAIQFQSFGLNLQKTCLQSDVQPPSSLYYDIFVQNAKSNYVEVYTNISSNLYKRFYKGNSNSISMNFKSLPPLTTPSMSLTQSQQKAKISTSSSSDTINLTLTIPFIIYNVFVFIAFVISFYKYMKYNPYDDQNDPYIMFKLVFLFLLKGIRIWGIALWIWLFGATAYCFCFYKFQQTVYLLLPDFVTQYLQYYDPFLIVFYLQFSFVFISVLLLIYDLGSQTDYFLIDWQKQKNLSNYDLQHANTKSQISVWRKILLVNQLYELTVNQIMDIPVVVLIGIFFLQGLNWINLSYQIPNSNNLEKDFSSSSTKNVVLAYFIITFIFFIIAAIQYILRNLIKIWKPLPYENFIDLCCISNISLIIFDHERHGYYIHGMNPLGQAEGSLTYIQSIFQKEAKSFGKSRAFKNNDPDQTQGFEVFFPKEIRHTFQVNYKTRYLQKLVGRAEDTSILTNPISKNLEKEDYKDLQNIQNSMVNNFKYYLQGVKVSELNVREQSLLGRMFSLPVDSQQIGQLPIFFKDRWHKFTQVLLNGHQFTLIINIINFINIFYIATSSVTIACLITMVVYKLFIKNIADFFIKRNISRNTFIDDQFFN